MFWSRDLPNMVIMNLSNDFFETFPEYSLPSTVSKNTMKKIGHRSRKRDMMDQCYPIYAACTGANHARYFISSGSKVC